MLEEEMGADREDRIGNSQPDKEKSKPKLVLEEVFGEVKKAVGKYPDHSFRIQPHLRGGRVSPCDPCC